MCLLYFKKGDVTFGDGYHDIHDDSPSPVVSSIDVSSALDVFSSKVRGDGLLPIPTTLSSKSTRTPRQRKTMSGGAFRVSGSSHVEISGF